MSSAEWTSTTAVESAPARVRWWRSLQTKTAAAIAVFAVALVLVSGALFANASLAGARDQLRQQAAGQVQLALASRAFGSTLPANVSTRSDAVPTVLRNALSGSSIATYDDGRSMWAARHTDSGGVISVQLSNAPITQEWARLRTTFATAGLLSIVASVVLAWFIAGGLTRRLRVVAASIDEAVDGKEVALPGGGDEVAVISAGIARSAQNLRARLDQEKAFAADVAHDLKTPLTALVSASSLLEDGPDADRVRRQVTRMRQLADDLLELGRAEAGIDSVVPESFSLATLVTDIVQDSPEAPLCSIVVVDDAVVLLDERRFARIVSNVLANARKHGRPPILLTIDGPAVTIHDHGDGFSEDLLRNGPRRFAHGGDPGATGLGLAIATHHTVAMGTSLTLSNAPDGGATVELRLPTPLEATRSAAQG